MRRFNYPMKHNWDTTQRVGNIIPTFCQYVTPLDTWSGRQVTVGRMSPLNKPVFGEFHHDQYLFYVPLPAIWNEDAHSGHGNFRDAIVDNSVGTWPTQSVSRSKGGGADLFSYLGMGHRGAAQSAETVSELPILAYNHIYNKMFLNEQVASAVALDANSVKNAYFKGGGYIQKMQADIELGATVTVNTGGATLDVDDIHDAMQESRYKQILEKYGTEYEDLLKFHGVQPSSLAREEVQLVARNSTNVGISEILTTATSASQNTGEYVGHGIVVNTMNVKPRLYLDYGILMGITVLRPRLVLKSKIQRMWKVADTEALYHKFFNNRSHVNVGGREFCSITSDAQRDSTVAYAEYYGWLRRTDDICAGEYLDADTWDDQLMAKEAGADAGAVDSLGAVMGVSDSDYDYLFQDSSEPHMFTHCMNRIGKRSQIPYSKGYVSGVAG